MMLSGESASGGYRFDSSSLVDLIRPSVLLSARSSDVWDWGGSESPDGGQGEADRTFITALPSKSWENLSPGESDEKLLDTYICRHREKLARIMADVQERGKGGDTETEGDVRCKDAGLWMDSTGRRMAHKEFVDVLVALDRLVDMLGGDPRHNSTIDRECSPHESDHLQEAASLETMRAGSLELTQSFEKLLSEVKELNRNAQDMRQLRQHCSAPMIDTKNSHLNARREEYTKCHPYFNNSTNNSSLAIPDTPDRQPSRWEKLTAMNSCLTRQLWGDMSVQSSCPSEMFRFIGLRKQSPAERCHRRSRCVSFSLPNSPDRRKPGRSRSLGSSRTPQLKAIEKLVLTGEFPPVTTSASRRPAIVFERQQRLRIPKPSTISWKPPVISQEFRTSTIVIPQHQSMTENEQYSEVDMTKSEQIKKDVPLLDLDFLTDDETEGSRESSEIVGTECVQEDKYFAKPPKPPTPPKKNSASKRTKIRARKSKSSGRSVLQKSPTIVPSPCS